MPEVMVGLRELFESLDSMGAAKILGSLGLTALILAGIRWYVDRRRWRHFKAAVHEWLEFLMDAGEKHPKYLREIEWQAECERMLVDALFRPGEVVELLELSVIVAKAIAVNKFEM